MKTDDRPRLTIGATGRLHRLYLFASLPGSAPRAWPALPSPSSSPPPPDPRLHRTWQDQSSGARPQQTPVNGYTKAWPITARPGLVSEGFRRLATRARTSAVSAVRPACVARRPSMEEAARAIAQGHPSEPFDGSCWLREKTATMASVTLPVRRRHLPRRPQREPRVQGVGFGFKLAISPATPHAVTIKVLGEQFPVLGGSVLHPHPMALAPLHEQRLKGVPEQLDRLR